MNKLIDSIKEYEGITTYTHSEILEELGKSDWYEEE